MEHFLAEIRMVTFNFAPRGWALCDGQLLVIAQHAALFTVLGTTYGGDGRITMRLPDLRGSVPMHAGSGPELPARNLGESGSLAKLTLDPESMSSVPDDPFVESQEQPYRVLNFIIALTGEYPHRS